MHRPHLDLWGRPRRTGRTIRAYFSHDFHIISVRRPHLDFVGATSGRPFLLALQKCGTEVRTKPRVGCRLPQAGGTDGDRRRILSVRSVLLFCRRFPFARAKPRAPRRGARSLCRFPRETTLISEIGSDLRERETEIHGYSAPRP